MGFALNIGLCAISFLMCFLLFFYGISCGFENEQDTGFSIVSLITIFVLIASLSMLVVGSEKLKKQEWNIADEPYRTDYIVSLNDDTQINGHFYLRHGYIEEDMYYQYMIKQNDGGYSYGKVEENKATIYISDSDYRVEWYTKQRNWLWFDEEDTFCKIYVPKGCIKEEYNIDLE